MINDVLKDTDERMKSAVSVLEEDLRGMRTGRASTALVEKLPVEYYGTSTPLFQLATITVPEIGGLRIERIVRLSSSGCEALDSFPMRLHW